MADGLGNIFNNVGDTIGGLFDNLTDEASDQFALVKDAYNTDNDEINATIEGSGANGKAAPAAYSMFNPFHVFRYSKFGMSDSSGTYQLERHSDSSGASPDFQGFGDSVSTIINEFKEFGEARESVENPTASEIIKWAVLNANTNSDDGAVQTPVPYTPTDFIWCKYYGKVPNNRLVTLRRYPFPIEDDIRIKTDFSPPVPIAQAVTWYGNDIGNELNKIINLSWGLNWKKLPPTEVNDLTGNEIRLDEALDVAGVKDDRVRDIVRAMMVTNGGDSIDMAKLSGYDESIQEYIRNAYGANGPYWNRILGPVNVVNETYIRNRGMAWQNDIVLKFEYSLRSYGGINPKIAFLDLLTNFLSLTYNTASFWGGAVRYFERTGVTIDGLGMENDILAGDVEGAIYNGLEMMRAQGAANLESVIETARNLVAGGKTSVDPEVQEASRELKSEFREQGKGITQQRVGETGADISKAGLVGRYFSQKLGNLMRKPLSFRSILDGRAIGEWHLVVGNPMNPMAMIGNLICRSVSMNVGETLGVDDFPTEFSFTVTLAHGRPRAKQDLESIFNLGNGAMSFSSLPQPSSARNSYGDATTATINELYATKDTGSGSAANDAKKYEVDDSALKSLGFYSRRVKNMYGTSYGKSNILKTYFTKLVTKD